MSASSRNALSARRAGSYVRRNRGTAANPRRCDAFHLAQATPHGGTSPMHKNVRNALVALGVAAIVTPAAVSDAKERDAHAHQEHRHGPPASVVEKKAKHGDKKVTYVFKGTYSADGVKVI